MTRYTLLNPLTGNTLTAAACELTHHLRVNHILLHAGKHIGIITHRDVVSFCRWCVEKTHAQCHTRPLEVYAALGLVDKWLIDPGSVSSEELKQAAAAAYAACPGDVAARAAWAASSAAGAADVAGSAAWAANSAGVPFEAQAQWLVEYLKPAQ